MAREKRRRVELAQNVYEAAVERTAIAFDLVDTPIVAFSGGKDSTIVLELALAEAKRRGRTPLRVVHFDEEAIPYDTENYVRRRFNDPDIDMVWYCVPVRHLNAASKKQPFWCPWDPEEEDLWVRPMPPEATKWDDPAAPGYLPVTHMLDPTKQPMGERPGIPQMANRLYDMDVTGTVGLFMGIRTAESLARYRTMRGLKEGFMTGGWLVRNVYPIYDWGHADVWRAIGQFDWDYNEAYDVMEMAGMTIAEQRCAPPYGAEPIRGLHRFKKCWPDIWEKMVYRVPGANTAAMYAHRTTMFTDSGRPKPDDQTWEEFIFEELKLWADPMRTVMAKRIKSEIERHYARTRDPILPETPHPDTGIYWGWLHMLAVRGDYKARKIAPRPHPDEREMVAVEWNNEKERLEAAGRLPRRARSGAAR